MSTKVPTKNQKGNRSFRKIWKSLRSKKNKVEGEENLNGPAPVEEADAKDIVKEDMNDMGHKLDDLERKDAEKSRRIDAVQADLDKLNGQIDFLCGFAEQHALHRTDAS